MWTGGWVWRSPYNLHCWGPAKKTCSPLCQGRGSLEQILSCCLKALGEGRYKWRHYKLRKAVSDTICACIQPSKHQLHTRHNIMARKTATRAQGLNRAASLSSWRASEDRPIRAAEIPSTHCRDIAQARHGLNIRLFQACGYDGAHCPLGGPHGGGPQCKTAKYTDLYRGSTAGLANTFMWLKLQ